MEDEIDLRKYINILLRHWKIIVGITLIAVVVAGLFSFLSPRIYEARSTVLIAKSASTLRPELITLVKSSTVATQVIEQLGDRLEPEEQKVERMLDKVQVVDQGGLIGISVRSSSPDKAASIANIWAESYESYANSPTSGLFQLPESLQIQADAAKKEYNEKQKALENFISANHIDEVSRQIADYESYIDSLVTGFSQSPENLQAQEDAARKEYEENQRLLVDFLRDNRIDKLGQQITDLELLCDAKALREQIEAGSPSQISTAANNLAVILLYARASTGQAEELQLSLDKFFNLNDNLDDVDFLISLLEARLEVEKGLSIDELQQHILQLTTDLEQDTTRRRELQELRNLAWETYMAAAGEVKAAEITQAGREKGQSISELQQEINQLKARLEQEQAQQRELEDLRDIALMEYTAATSKMIQAKIAAQSGEPSVQIVDAAVVPASPVAPRKSVNIGIGLIIGLIVGVFAAFVAEYFKRTGKKPEAGRKD